MGHFGNIALSQVQELATNVATRCRKLGTLCGIVGSTPGMATRFVALGRNFVAVASDLGMLIRQTTSFIEAIRSGPARGFDGGFY